MFTTIIYGTGTTVSLCPIKVMLLHRIRYPDLYCTDVCTVIVLYCISIVHSERCPNTYLVDIQEYCSTVVCTVVHDVRILIRYTVVLLYEIFTPAQYSNSVQYSNMIYCTMQ